MRAIEAREGVLLDELCELTPGGTFGNIIGLPGDKVLGVKVFPVEGDTSCGDVTVEGWIDDGLRGNILWPFSIVCDADEVATTFRFNS